MTQIKAISSKQLHSFCKDAEFSFKTTDDLPDFEGMVGQSRAIEALSFAIEMDKPGYNMFLMGPNGLGKRSLLKQLLSEIALPKNEINDWCYLNNINNTQRPIVIKLAAGQAHAFRAAMQQLLITIDYSLVYIFKEEVVKNQKQIIQEELPKLFTEIKTNYIDNNAVHNYLLAVEKDILENTLSYYDGTESYRIYEESKESLNFKNYEVNIIVENENKHTPIIIQDNPTLQKLFGQIEYVSESGSLITDYNYIKAGDLHKANGGYLIIDANKLLQQPVVWQTLKLAIKNNKIEIPTDDTSTAGISLVSMQPEAIPLNLKIILIGRRSLYYYLIDNDDDFDELFKVEVDFSDTIESSKESLQQYAQVIATLARKNKLAAFDRDAVTNVIEFGMRQIEDTTQLSTHMHSILEILIESDYWARKNNSSEIKVIQREDVQFAIEKQIYRADRSRENIYDEINKGSILLDVSGEKVASVNGLFVIETGRLEFAQPARITANVRIGDGDIMDIEREVDLGGPLHSKGVLILSSYLGSRYATSKPLSFSASLVFEQSYASVDGDSATVGELCTLLSAISKLPLKQSLAITGSADQHGNIQVIGGINEKIEGFYDICKLKGFSGEQGVIIPAENIPHLILRDDVVEAVKNKQFFLYPINTVDEAISLLTGLPAGERNSEGEFPTDSANFRIEQSLLALAELKHEDQQKDEHDHDNAEHDRDKESKKTSENLK